jgi:3-(3-hydroxy-phenyl)propionate hydroxylase
MQPYTYSESPLTPYASRDAEFASGPLSGSAAPNAELADGLHLLDRAGYGLTAMLFCDGFPSAEQTAVLAQLGKLDTRFVALLVQRQSAVPAADATADGNGEIMRLFGAQPGTCYLLRPDLHIAGRWKTMVASEILKTARLCLGKATP